MSDYLLGHHEAEWQRLDAQHALWRDVLLADLRRAGLKPGARVLDVGCGVGSLLADLASVVGPTGAAVGVERDHAASAFARKRFEHLDHVRIVEADLTEDPLPNDFDLVVCRWVLSFVADVDSAVARLAEALRPGGRLVVQDYDHDGVNLFPSVDGFAEVIEAYRAAYRDTGGDLYVAPKLPRVYAQCGLVDVELHPHALASGPGGGAWTWVSRFVTEHLHEVVASGHLDAQVAKAFRTALRRAEADSGAVLVSPIVMSVVGRR